jgi:hypothetical protein
MGNLTDGAGRISGQHRAATGCLVNPRCEVWNEPRGDKERTIRVLQMQGQLNWQQLNDLLARRPTWQFSPGRDRLQM